MISAVYEMELEHIRERTQQGRELAKLKGNFKGRLKGAVAKDEVLLKKHSDIVNCLKQGMSMNKTAITLKKNRATVKRISEILKSKNRQTSILDYE
jgi:DNA invertase Pin-like site-specific DNA recombinase